MQINYFETSSYNRQNHSDQSYQIMKNAGEDSDAEENNTFSLLVVAVYNLVSILTVNVVVSQNMRNRSTKVSGEYKDKLGGERHGTES